MSNKLKFLQGPTRMWGSVETREDGIQLKAFKSLSAPDLISWFHSPSKETEEIRFS